MVARFSRPTCPQFWAGAAPHDDVTADKSTCQECFCFLHACAPGLAGRSTSDPSTQTCAALSGLGPASPSQRF